MRLSQTISQNLSLQLSTSLALDDGLDDLHGMVKENEDNLLSAGFIKEVKTFLLGANKRQYFSRKLPARHFLKSDSSLLERVICFAIRRHYGEYRESGHPYLAHVLSTGFILSRLGFPREIIMSGLIHDSIEDSNDKLSTINQIYDMHPAFAYYVLSVSGPDIHDSVEKDKVLSERINSFSDNAGNIFPQAIKCADGIANLYDLEAMQAKDGRSAGERKHVFVEKLRNKVLPYADMLDKGGYIPIRKRNESFSLYEYLLDKTGG